MIKVGWQSEKNVAKVKVSISRYFYYLELYSKFHTIINRFEASSRRQIIRTLICNHVEINVKYYTGRYRQYRLTYLSRRPSNVTSLYVSANKMRGTDEGFR